MLNIKMIQNRNNKSFNAHKVAVIVAHPDDETIGCGILLKRLIGVKVFFLTNGILNPKYYFKEKRIPIQLNVPNRLQECVNALKLVHIHPDNIHFMNFNDLSLCDNLQETIHAIANFIHKYNIQTIITHAYEGGHPDHDATAFCVRKVVSIMEQIKPINILEMPLYHLFNGKIRTQYFSDEDQGVILFNDFSDRILKSHMISMYVSQLNILKDFRITDERFRVAKNYNFLELPNNGQIFYSSWNCPFNSSLWKERVSRVI